MPKVQRKVQKQSSYAYCIAIIDKAIILISLNQLIQLFVDHEHF